MVVFARYYSCLLVHLLFVSVTVPAVGGKRNLKASSRAPPELFSALQDASATSASVNVSDNKVSDIQENDLWGIRDMLLMGYGAVFMKPNSTGMEEVRKAVISLMDHLPLFHPVKKCREAIDGVNTKYACKDNEPKLRGASTASALSMRVKDVAEASWKCLEGHPTLGPFSKDFFLTTDAHGALREAIVDEKSTDQTQSVEGMYGKNPTIKDDAKIALSACKTTKWDRACSYWSAFHTMAFRADLTGMGQTYLRIVLPIIAGGALGCGGCTMHFRLMNLYGLSKHMDEDFDTLRVF
eukprot:TRINITY_DN64830_c0_g1_i1.p1 TRINITY_DN64830_c0_g1~~TRINITY_DN64830_c0_g1_i1.p1  ORF type:complete len:307 (+),score=40.99 TRINITY_DN64830_c0_g1_i1:35-922(+)